MLKSHCKDALVLPIYPYDMETMGSRIRTLRKAKGHSQEQLADICGVTGSAVSQWENDLTADIKLVPLFKLLRALGTDLAYLVFGESRTPPDSAPRSSTDRKAS
jgi:transcriptional regulator with XRE-family HTH domain